MLIDYQRPAPSDTALGGSNYIEHCKRDVRLLVGNWEPSSIRRDVIFADSECSNPTPHAHPERKPKVARASSHQETPETAAQIQLRNGTNEFQDPYRIDLEIDIRESGFIERVNDLFRSADN